MNHTTLYRLHFEGDYFAEIAAAWVLDALQSTNARSKPQQVFFQSQDEWIPVRRNAVERAWAEYQASSEVAA
jgi:hypothetical protein